MRKKNTGNWSRLRGTVLAVIALALCAALAAIVLPAPGIASAQIEGMASPVVDVSAAEGLRPLMMKAPDNPVTSGDVNLPEAPK